VRGSGTGPAGKRRGRRNGWDDIAGEVCSFWGSAGEGCKTPKNQEDGMFTHWPSQRSAKGASAGEVTEKSPIFRRPCKKTQRNQAQKRTKNHAPALPKGKGSVCVQEKSG